jgi:hypothetical protein
MRREQLLKENRILGITYFGSGLRRTTAVSPNEARTRSS